MTPKQKLQFNVMLATLKKISKSYMTPNEIRRDSDSGLDYEEYLEMAYENIQQDARQAAKGVRQIK